MGLVIEHVTKRFGKMTAVNDISLELESGKMLGFLGRNGAGKTTTFRMILGLSEPTEGHITYNGKKLDKTMYNRIGYLPEERGLHAKMTVEDELKYLATLKGMSKKDIQSQMTYWLDRFDITENRKKRIDSLSKGNQQKIQLLASMLHKPELLILDEPFSGLDPVNVELLKEAVKDLNDWGSTIVYSSHRMEHVEELCDDVCILDKGKLIVSGDIQHVRSSNGYQKVVIESEAPIPDLSQIDGIIQSESIKQGIRLTIEDEAVAKNIYQVVTQQGYVKRFQVVEPSLQDIFIAKVGGKDE
ncbi:ABC transporter ATP-binding protein [Staphylococcus argenteus]|uniref:Na+-efflux ABC transporter (ATP-binding protein) n=3 Tax=Staphylococcus TaxID=1279 RepID=A0A7U7PWW2_9STAP|nr:ABC transporter ATP-binding protein [Staphylococcus argenteus]BBN31360.1 ABC superfamily ATP binding cassette transporter, ABC protein [Staphylococcus aureus]API80251.1 sodium ABC transporter ATP-binding protein [Staphylococcus argenteus]ATY57792.1 sodium ABC transporter ATP-binding protein [Staphylococcus argenteus]ATZ88016.1 sodium ABC transporter ATP-binding protein [Staphylococcus argenteus]EKF1504657.1 ABC transporter ATP-binding protein [Staphylococcus argenteus]